MVCFCLFVFTVSYSDHIFKLRCRRRYEEAVPPDPGDSQAPCSCLGFHCECMSECVDETNTDHPSSPTHNICMFKLPSCIRTSPTGRERRPLASPAVLCCALWVLLVRTSWNRVALDSLTLVVAC